MPTTPGTMRPNRLAIVRNGVRNSDIIILMSHKVTVIKDCTVECWSGRTDSYVDLKEGDEFFMDEEDQQVAGEDYILVNDELYGDMYIPKDCVGG